MNLKDEMMVPSVEGFRKFVKIFFREQYKIKFMWSEHHNLIASTLIDVYKGDKTHVIINMPPRYSKTELVIKLFNAWTYALNPACNSLHLSYSASLAHNNNASIISTMQLPFYAKCFKDSCFTKAKVSVKEWVNRSGGKFLATSAGGQVTGFGAGRVGEIADDGTFKFSGAIYIDDPLKPDDAFSQVKREFVNERWDSTIKSRTNTTRTPVIIVMQRLHEADFVGKLLADSEYEWHRLILPAILDDGTPDARPLFPAKHTLADLERMRAKNKYVFDCQYMQDPSPAGGGLFNVDNFGTVPSELIDDAIKRCTTFIMTADTAYTKDTRNDPSVIQLWGFEGKASAFLLDEIRGWWEFSTLVTRVSLFHSQWTERTRRGQIVLFVEAKASGKSLVQQLRVVGGVPTKEWVPKHYKYPDDKVGRAEYANWSIISGDVYYVDDAPWSATFREEIEKFTRTDTHAHDDQVDAMTMAIAYWTRQGGGKKANDFDDKR